MICGFINVCKVKGMTSSRVVGKIKGILRAQGISGVKVGHMGTLDPMASGVLPVAVGNSSRLFNYLLNKEKIYRAVFRFGVEKGRLVMFLIIFLVCAAAGAMGGILQDVSSGGQIPLSWAGALPAAAVILSALSIPLSIRLYRRRDD